MKYPLRQTTLPCEARRAKSDPAGGGLTKGIFIYTLLEMRMRGFINYNYFSCKSAQAPRQYDDFPKRSLIK